MGRVEFNPVKTTFLGFLGRANEIFFDSIHIFSCCGTRLLRNTRKILLLRGGDKRPTALIDRFVDSFPSKFCRALCPSMTELERDLCIRVCVNKVHNPFPRCRMLFCIHSWTTWSDSCISSHASHLSEDKSCSSHCAST